MSVCLGRGGCTGARGKRWQRVWGEKVVVVVVVVGGGGACTCACVRVWVDGCAPFIFARIQQYICISSAVHSTLYVFSSTLHIFSRTC